MAPKPAKAPVSPDLYSGAMVDAVKRILGDVKSDYDDRINQIIREATTKEATASAQLDALRALVDSSAREARHASDDARLLRTDLTDLVSRQIDDMAGQVDVKLTEFDDFTDLTTEQIGKFADDIVEITDGFSAKAKDLAQSIARLRTVSGESYEKLRDDFESALERDVAALRGEITRVVDSVTTDLAIAAGVSDRVADIEKQIAELTEALEKEQQAAAELHLGLKKDDARIQADARARIKELESELKDLAEVCPQAKAIQIDESLDALRQQVAAQVSLMGEVQGALKSYKEDFETQFLDSVTSLSDRIEEELHARAAVSKRVAQTEVLLEKVKSDCEGLTSRAAFSSEGTKDLLAEIEGMSKSLAGLDQRFTDARHDIQAHLDDAVSGDQIETLSKTIDEKIETVAGDIEKLFAAGAETWEVLERMQASDDARATDIVKVNQDIQRVIDSLAGAVRSIDAAEAKHKEAVAASIGEVREEIEEVETRLELQVQESVESLRSFAEEEDSKVIERVLGEIHQAQLESRVWTGGGPEYKTGTVVRHHGGLWYCAAPNLGEPGQDSAWVCLVNGVKSYEVEDLEGKLGHRVKVTDSMGRESSSESEAQTFNFRKTWERGGGDDGPYKKWDVVIRDGHRYVALRNDPQGDPKISSHWALFSMRGLKGRKGDKGDPPSMGEITKAIETVLGEIPGIPLRSFRGTWTYQEQFYRGDLVVYDNAIVIAVNDNDGMVAPGIMPGAGFNSDWRILYKISTPSLPRNAVKMDLDYVAGKAVEAYTQVAVNGWLMISNTPTSDGAEPYPTTDWSWAVYDGAVDPTWTAASTDAVQLLTGVRIKDARALEVADVRAWIPFVDPDVRYFIMAVSNEENDNPSFAPIFPVQTGWYNLTTGLHRLYETGLEVDLYLVTQGQGSSNQQFTGEWDYRNIGANPNPVNGPSQGDFKQYGTNAPDTAYWSVFDRDLTDRSADMATLVAGDEVSFEWSNPINTPGTTSWVLLENPVYYDNGDVGEGRGPFYDIKLSPPDVPPSGEQSWRDFTITHYLDRPTSYVRIPGNFTGNTIVRGLFSTTGLSNVAETDDSYGIDVYFRPWAKSDDWTVLSMPS